MYDFDIIFCKQRQYVEVKLFLGVSITNLRFFRRDNLERWDLGESREFFFKFF